eukprot:6369105-Prorocentrum_lima.AAC.1
MSIQNSGPIGHSGGSTPRVTISLQKPTAPMWIDAMVCSVRESFRNLGAAAPKAAAALQDLG